jgi:hypothetical protein
MPSYNISPGIIASSLDELKIIQTWAEETSKNFEKPAIVLIGGWAVDSYNSWYGSVDIDLVTTSDVRNDLKYYLRTEHGYLESREELQMPSGIEKKTDEGAIIIDFIPKGTNNPFEGQDNPFNFSIIGDHVNLKSIRNVCEIYVPTRTILLFLKLKAAWDRNYRIEHNTSHDPDWDKTKLIKDNADILALLDQKSGGMDIDLDELGTLISRYPFLTQTLLKIKDSSESHERYGKLKKTEISTIFKVIEDYFGVE